MPEREFIQRGLRVQEMPDFNAAMRDYKDILHASSLPLEDVLSAEKRILKNNRTRKDGNRFINLVNELSRKFPGK